MDIRVKPTTTYDPTQDVARKKIWINTWDEGSVVLFKDEVIHVCSRVKQDTTILIRNDRPANCPNSCGVRFDPRAYEETRKLLKL